MTNKENLKDNYCFNVMKNINQMYQNLVEAHENKKESIIETYGWNSPETIEWYEKYDKLKKEFPFTGGQCKAYRAWQSSVQWDHGVIVLDEFLWDDEVNDFIQTLKKAKISEFIYTNSSSAVMDNIHGFINAGCNFVGVCEIQNEDKYYNKIVRGIRFKLIEEN